MRHNPHSMHYLVEPSMAIEPSAEAQRYNGLIDDLGRLRQKMNREGIDSLTVEEQVHVIMVAAMENENSIIRDRIAAEAITARSSSPKLSQRFLCAVWPPYLNVRSTDGWVRQQARAESLAFYDKNLAEFIEAKKPKDYSTATVLEGALRVRKPLTLGRMKGAMP